MLASHFEDGIEFFDGAPPGRLVKAMQRRWAEALRDHGSIRFGSLEL